ncbi:hypothetical protein ACFQ05_04340 [Amycolatopsis umgeniensis]|uniref:Uncharacterized protein n=1 Tax=Amycolatopsis umgeniensis TaxID=336628 RepID=A0A841B1X9_9PSEU|nr:hypothetical protein [Amycolatopsis umgeniensis]MBB5852494.1 hypothetical protein [Amycolatopsis umgeniensis]
MPNSSAQWSVKGDTFAKSGSKPTAEAAWTAARNYADPHLQGAGENGVGEMAAITVNGLTTSVTKDTLHREIRDRIAASK